MAEYIKIPSNFFESEPIKSIEDDSTILLYLHLLCESHKHGRGVFSIGNIVLTDDMLYCVFRFCNLGERLSELERYGLIKRTEKSIHVFKFWDDLHDRNSQRYKDWRMSVFKRDGFHCVVCGSKDDIQAHHIDSWKNNKELRYETKNGITLCRTCHLKAHGGCWRNG